MRRIRWVFAHPYRSLAVVAVLAAAVYWSSRPSPLKFVELTEPKGFRALVLKSGGSGFDPVWSFMRTPSSAPVQNVGSVCELLRRDAASPVAGSRQGTVSVVEFSDYRCPYCKVLAKILTELREEGSIHIVHKEWPILSQYSELGARAALAAHKQGKYLAMHEQLMQSRLLPTAGYIEDLGRRLELDQTQLNEDMSSTETTAALTRNNALARKLGLVGTPALVVGRTIVEGAVSKRQLKALIALENRPNVPC